MIRLTKTITPARLLTKFERANKAFNNMLDGAKITGNAMLKYSKTLKDLETELVKSQTAAKMSTIQNKPEATKAKKCLSAEKKKDKERIQEGQRIVIELKRSQEKIEAKKQKERRRIENEDESKNRMETRVIDESSLIKIHLNKNTVIMVKPGTDIEATKQKFRNRNNL